MTGFWRRTGSSLLVGVALCCAALPAHAQASADDLARQHFESGTAYLAESDYENALRAFEKAYQLSKRPEILVNIATVHERLGKFDAAVKALEQYLSAAPDGEHAETVKLRIENLKKRIAEQGKSAPAPTPAPTPPAPATTAPTPAPTPAPAPAEPNRVPAYVAFGLGGLAAAGAVLTGVLAQSEYDNAKSECAPSCSDDELSSGKSLALTSTILTGVAVVGAGVGAVLWMTAGGSAEQPAPSAKRPRIDVMLAPGSASASAAWKF